MYGPRRIKIRLVSLLTLFAVLITSCGINDEAEQNTSDSSSYPIQDATSTTQDVETSETTLSDSDSTTANGSEDTESTTEQVNELSEGELREVTERYYEEADKAQEALWSIFWDESRAYLRRDYPHQEDDRGIDYWWFAHSIDTQVDAYQRTGNDEFLERADKIAKGVYERTGNSFINDYFDDMEWMGLALLRYYDETQDEFYLEHSEILFKEVSEAWSGIAGGGIGWNRESLNFKNTPSNAPAVMLAVRLFERTGNEDYSDWAFKIFDYLHEYLRRDDGFLIDGIRSANEEEIIANAYTYNHGTYMGAASEMYRLTGDEKYLQYADETFDNAMETYNNSRGVISETGEGDGGLFKGILLRYAAFYYFTNPDRPEKVREWVRKNADSVIEYAISPFGLIADRWNGPFKREQHLSSHLSGVKLLEGAWRLHQVENDQFINEPIQ